MSIIKIIIAKAFELCYAEKMLQNFNQNYINILKTLLQKFATDFVKTGVNFILFIYWVVIVIGTFLMLN